MILSFNILPSITKLLQRLLSETFIFISLWTAGEIVVVEGMLTLYEGAEVKDISGNVAPATPKKSENPADSNASTKKD